MMLGAVAQLAVSLMAEHLDPVEPGWRFEFDNAKRRAGCCQWRYLVPGDRSSIVPSKITLSRHLMALWDEEHVRSTILHEIAHALAGHEENHGPRFRAIARSLGIPGDRCYSADLPSIEPPLIGVCPMGHVSPRKRHKKPTRGRMISCGVCSPGQFNPDAVYVWTRNPAAGRPAETRAPVAASTPPPPPAAPALAAVPASAQETLF